MPFEFIQIPANGQGNAKEELNKLLRGGRITSVRKEFVANGEDSFWAFCIEFLDGAAQSMGLNRSSSRSYPVFGCDKTERGPSGAGRQRGCAVERSGRAVFFAPPQKRGQVRAVQSGLRPRNATMPANRARFPGGPGSRPGLFEIKQGQDRSLTLQRMQACDTL